MSSYEGANRDMAAKHAHAHALPHPHSAHAALGGQRAPPLPHAKTGYSRIDYHRPGPADKPI